MTEVSFNNLWTDKEIENIESALSLSFEHYLFREKNASPDYPDGLCREITIDLLQNQMAQLKDKDMAMEMLGFDSTRYCANSLIGALDWDKIENSGRETIE